MACQMSLCDQEFLESSDEDRAFQERRRGAFNPPQVRRIHQHATPALRVPRRTPSKCPSRSR